MLYMYMLQTTYKQQIKAIDNNFKQEIPGQVHFIN